MKKTILMLLLAFVALNAFAQSRKPEQGDMGFTFGIQAFRFPGFTNPAALIGSQAPGALPGVNTAIIPTGTLLFRYYIADDMAGRLGVKFGSGKFTTEFHDSAYGVQDTSVSWLTDTVGRVTTTEAKTSSWGINLGIQKSLGDNEKIEPYVGLDLFIGGGKNGAFATTDSLVELDNGASRDIKFEPGSSFNLGVTPFVGFNWFLFKGFAIGAEFGYGLGISNTKAGTVMTTYTQGKNTIGKPGDTISNTQSSKNMNIGGRATGFVTVSVIF